MIQRLHIILYLVLGLLLLLPMVFASTLVWQEYLRLVVITLGLGYFWWKYRDVEQADVHRITTVFLALGFMFVITQFDPGRSAGADHAVWRDRFFWIPAGLALLGFVSAGGPGSFRRNALTTLDWVVIVTAVVAVALSTGAFLFLQGRSPLGISVRFVVYLMLWFLFTHGQVPDLRVRSKLVQGMLAVFCVVCIVGGARIGVACYHYLAGDGSRKQAAYDRAVGHYLRAESAARSLGLAGIRDASLFGRAEVLFKQGKEGDAAEILGMEEGFVQVIQPEEWEGPAGGILYTNLSCWKDLQLYAGRIDVQIFARGQPAVSVWPRMQVKLGNRILGEVEVSSSETRPYVLSTDVETGRQRLEISFMNDYYDLPNDRNLWVEQAEIRYQEIAWR